MPEQARATRQDLPGTAVHTRMRTVSFTEWLEDRPPEVPDAGQGPGWQPLGQGGAVRPTVGLVAGRREIKGNAPGTAVGSPETPCGGTPRPHGGWAGGLDGGTLPDAGGGKTVTVKEPPSPKEGLQRKSPPRTKLGPLAGT